MPAAEQEPESTAAQRPWVSLAKVVFLLFVFLCGVRGLGNGFEALGEDLLVYFFTATSNPFIGLAIGLLATTLVQSSSVTTSLIVGLVAAPQNPLPVAAAVPMVMGANIGTTVTNTIVSLGHIGRPAEFRRAFAAATCHDFFNFIAVAVFLPLELMTGYLRRVSGAVAGLLANQGGLRFPNPLKDATNLVLDPLMGATQAVAPGRLGALLMIAISVAAIFGTLFLIVKTLRALTATRLETYVTGALGMNPMVGLVIGAVVTTMVQSSSITTSILVPLAGAGIVALEQIFPITLGANVGTTVTAMLATLGTAESGAQAALQIALAHFFFNLSGIVVVYPLRATRQVPLRAARWLADVAVRSRRWALLYVLILFYGVPALLIAISRLL